MSNKRRQKLSWDAMVEDRIRQAQEEGQFDDLPGFGKKCPAIDEPYDEFWWVRRFLQREGLTTLPDGFKPQRDV